MNEIKKRGLYGLIYVIIMWTATDISEISFHILFILILLLATYEMLRMKAKKSLLPFLNLLNFGLSRCFVNFVISSLL